MTDLIRFDTHVMLVSRQPSPNLIPALDPRLKPRAVVMLVTPDMVQQGDWLRDVLQPAGIKVSQVTLPDPYDVPAMRDQVLNVVSDREAESLVLNATGGTKLMAIAAYEVFSSAGLPVFYVHPDEDRLIWLYPYDKPTFTLANQIRLPVFLRAHGTTVVDRPAHYGVQQVVRDLAKTLVLNVATFQSALRTLNFLAATAANSPQLRSKPLGHALRDPHLGALLEQFKSAELLTIEQDCLRFADESARFFANGGWLEQYVYSVVQSLKAETTVIQDIGRGLDVTRSQKGQPVKNELDVVFLARNRLYIVECKTRQFKDEKGPVGAGPGAEALYKLEALRGLLGGLQAKAMLVSYQPLTNDVLDRARNYRIKTCDGAQLDQLGEQLQAWME